MLLISMSRSTRTLTVASIPRSELEQPEPQLGDQGQPHAEQRRDERAVDLEALAEQAGEVAGGEQHQ